MIDLDTGAHVSLVGAATETALEGSLFAVFDLADLSAESVSIELESGSEAAVRVGGRIDGHVAGASRLRLVVKGEPEVHVEVSADSEIERR